MKQFPYRTDDHSSVIEAECFEDACFAFDRLFTPETLEDGAWGYIVDPDNQEPTYEVGIVP